MMVLILVLTSLTFVGDKWSSSSSAVASPGCRVVSPGSTTLTLNVNGFKRVVVVHVPLGTKASTPKALVLNLHGSFNTATYQETLSNMDATANANKFIVAYPQAYIASNGGYQWNVTPLYGGAVVPPNSPNDVSFLTNLVKILERHYCIDPKRVYATGYSGGAREVSQLGCQSSTVFAAIAPVDGLRMPSPCNARRAVSVIAFHGSADPINPFDGNGQAYWTYSVTSAINDWGSQDGCTSSVTIGSGTTTVVRTQFSGCANGSSVELYEVIGEGHEWPGGPPVSPSLLSFLGPQKNAISASALMWSFFRSHRLR